MRPSRKPRIFIADDDPGIVDLLRTRLELAGYETAFARDGAAAVAGIRSTQPSAVVLDLGMPRLDGFEVLRHLRSQSTTRGTPVLVLTARHAPEDVRMAVSCGAQDYLSKPFDDTQLLRRVARLLRKRAPAADSAPAAEPQVALDDTRPAPAGPMATSQAVVPSVPQQDSADFWI